MENSNQNIETEKKDTIPGLKDIFGFRNKIVIAFILITTTICFLPSINNELVLWDDDKYILDNPLVATSSGFNFYGILTTYIWGNYHPLTIFTFAAEYKIFGANPLPYHVDNLLLHLANTFLVFLFIFMISKNLFISSFCSLLFGMHPMHVESVAWISERKDVLYAFFYLAGCISYVLYIKKKESTNPFLLLATGFFLFGLLSKALTATLPLTFLLIDVYFRRPLKLNLLTEKISFFLLSLIFGILAIHAQESGGAMDKAITYSLFERILIAAYGISTYCVRIFYPINLSIFYPYPVKVDEALPLIFYLNPVLLIIGSTMLRVFKNVKSELFFGIGFFIITILLVLQILPVGDASKADRYTYLPYIGLFFILANILQLLFDKIKVYNKFILLFCFFSITVFVIFLGVVTWQRCTVWHNTGTIFTDLISKFDNIPVSYNNRGNWHRQNGRIQEALDDYQMAIKLDPNFLRAYHNRGLLFYSIGRSDLALNDFNIALKLNPNSEKTSFLRGKLLFDLKQYDYALQDLNRAIANEPNLAEAYFIKGIIFNNSNKTDEAIKNFNIAIHLKSNFFEAYSNLGKVYFQINKFEEAFKYINQAISINPKFADAYASRGVIFQKANRLIESLQDFNTAISLDSSNAEFIYNRGNTYNYLKKQNEAMNDYLFVLKLDSAHFKTWHNLGVLYFNNANYTSAKSCFDVAIKINPSYGEAYFSRSFYLKSIKNFYDAYNDALKADSLGKELPKNYISSLKDSIK